MERKKRRGRPLPNNVSADVAQNGDVHIWQTEAEGNSSNKKSASSDSPTQPYFPPFYWPFAQHPSGQPQSAYVRMPGEASHAQSQAQAQAQSQSQSQSQERLQSQGAHQSLPPEGVATHSSLHSASGETAWQQGAPRPPPPFSFLPPPLPGPWDPWWGHNPYPPPFPYLFPSYGSGYPCPPPPILPMGTNQRGLIKPPPGLSQKHVQMWEAQSMENMQLWTTTTQLWAAVARADAEISLQRGKIIKLEADVQAMKAHRTESTLVTAPSITKRSRHKKATPTLSSIPTISSIPDRALAPVRKLRANAEKLDLTQRKAPELEEKRKYTIACQAIEEVYRPTMTGTKECSLLVDTVTNEGGLPKSPQKHMVECQGSSESMLVMTKDELAFSHLDHHLNHFRPSTFHAMGKDNNFNQNLGMKESIVSFLKSSGNVDPQGVIVGDSSFMAAMNQQTNSCVRNTNGYDARKDNTNATSSLPGGHYNDNNNVEESNTIRLQKVIPGWRYMAENGSEQDDAVALARDDDEPDEDEDEDEDEDDEPNIDDMNSKKVGNCTVLDHLSMKWQ